MNQQLFTRCFGLIALILFWGVEANGQAFSQACANTWAGSLLPDLPKILKTEKLHGFFVSRPCRILVLPFYKARNSEGFEAGGFDTTVLGQYLSRSFASRLGLLIRDDEKLQTQLEILPSNENVIFQSNFIYTRPEKETQESEHNKLRLYELQPDFLLGGEYELNDEGLSLLSLSLTKVGHKENKFPKSELPLFSGKWMEVFPGLANYAELKAKDVKPFDSRPIRELMDQFTGFPLKSLSLFTMKLGHDSFTLDSLEGDLQANVFYKMAVRLPARLYVYAFSYEKLDADKKYLYFIQSLGDQQAAFSAGKTIFPPAKAGIGFSIPETFEEGYQIYFKVFATEEPVYLSTIDKKKQVGKISYLSPELAKKFLDQLKAQKAKGKKVYTAELTKFLEK